MADDSRQGINVQYGKVVTAGAPLVYQDSAVVIAASDLPVEVFFPDGTSAEFSTLTDALAAATAGSVVLARAGIYNENVTIPSGVTLSSKEIGQTVTIAGADASSTRVTMNPSSELSRVNVSCPSAGTGNAIRFAQAGVARVENVEVELQGHSGPAVYTSGTMICDQVVIVGNGSSGDAGFVVDGGRMTLLNSIHRFGTLRAFIECLGVCQLSASLCSTNGIVNSCTDAVRVAGAATEIFIQTSRFTNCDVALAVDSDGPTIILQATILDGTTADVEVDASLDGTGTSFSMNACTAESSKVIVPPGFYANSTNSLAYESKEQFDEAYKFAAELHVGTPERGRESALGEGDSYTRGMLAYTETSAGVFTDITTAAKSPSGSTFAFPGTAADSALYFASTLSDGTDVLQVQGNRFTIVTGTGGTGAIVAEYWNGAAWVEVSSMATLTARPYTRYGNSLFARDAVSEHVRLDINIGATWAKNDPVGIGTDFYWLRYRVTSAVTAAPVLQQARLHCNRVEINPEGYIEYHALARPRRGLGWDLGQLEAANLSPANQDVFASSTVGVGRIENEFQNGATDRIGTIVALPADLDSSSPVRINVLAYAETGGGNYRAGVRAAVLIAGDTMTGTSGSAPASAVDQIDNIATVAAPVAINTTQLYQFDIDLSTAINRAESRRAFLAITFERQGGDAADTNGGNLVVAALEATYLAWSNGRAGAL